MTPRTSLEDTAENPELRGDPAGVLEAAVENDSEQYRLAVPNRCPAASPKSIAGARLGCAGELEAARCYCP